MNQEKLKSAKNLFFIALGIDIAVTALVAITDFWAAGVLSDIRSGVSTSDQSTNSSLEFWESFSKVMILTLIGVGLALVRWLDACYTYAKENLKATEFAQEKWITFGWLVPFMNVFKPYQVLVEIYKVGAADCRGSDDWKKLSGSGMLLVWWIFWVIAHMVMSWIGKQALKSAFRDDLTLNQIIDMYYGSIIVCVISLIVAGLWFVVAGSLTHRLLNRKSLLIPISSSNKTSQQPRVGYPGTSQSISNQHLVAAPAVMQPAAVVMPTASTTVDKESTQNNKGNFEITTKQELNMENLEDWAYEKVGEELESNKPDKAAWTKAFAQSGGDEKQIKVLYIKQRVEKLIALAKEELRKSRELEELRKSQEAEHLQFFQGCVEMHRAAEAEVSKEAEKNGLLVCGIDMECQELGIKNGDVIIFYNGVDVRNNMALFLRQLESSSSSAQSVIRLIRENQFIALSVRGGNLGLKLSQLV
jgi:hypothetical protein